MIHKFETMVSNMVLFVVLASTFVYGDLPSIRIAEDGTSFITADKKPFVIWGVNYDHDAGKGGGEMLDEYWDTRWKTVVEDLNEIKALGANVVRIHLQIGLCMQSATEADPDYLARLAKLLDACDDLGLYVDITGLACYHKQHVPDWYDALPEAERWAVQARFWEAVAAVGKGRACVFCYDLMNEPVVPGKKEDEWLTGELGGKFFVQRLVLDSAGRDRRAIAREWINQMVDAIRRHDAETLITLGVIPWPLTFPKANPFFYDPEVGAKLNFVSVHFYPRKGEVEQALIALNKFELGKPLVIEEIFPLKAGLEETAEFIHRSRGFVDGWISFYWGKTAAEYAQEKTIQAAIVGQWLQWFAAEGQKAGK